MSPRSFSTTAFTRDAATPASLSASETCGSSRRPTSSWSTARWESPRPFCADCARRMTLTSAGDAGMVSGSGDCVGSLLSAAATTRSKESAAATSFPPDACAMAWRRTPDRSAASAAARCSGVIWAWPASDANSCAEVSASLVLCVNLSGFTATFFYSRIYRLEQAVVTGDSGGVRRIPRRDSSWRLCFSVA